MFNKNKDNEVKKANPLNNTKQRKNMVGVFIIIALIAAIFSYKKLSGVDLNIPVFEKGLTLSNQSVIEDTLITSDKDNRIQIKYKVSNPIETYTLCSVLSIKGEEIKDGYCILPLGTELGILDVPKANDYILRVYNPADTEQSVIDYQFSLKALAKNKQSNLTGDVLSQEQVKSTNQSVIDRYIIAHKEQFANDIMTIGLEKSAIVYEIRSLKKQVKEYKGKDQLNYDDAVTKLYDKNKELDAKMKEIKDKYEYVIRVLRLNPKIYNYKEIDYVDFWLR